ncbi:MAG: hypothetical protein Kow00129_03880 [Thermoleophilia bacterium]
MAKLPGWARLPQYSQGPTYGLGRREAELEREPRRRAKQEPAAGVNPRAEEIQRKLAAGELPDVEPSESILREKERGLENAVFGSMTRIGPAYVLITLALGLGVAAMFSAWGYQVWKGIGVAGINRPAFWGFYITSFVFWIGVSHAGTLISAILRVLNVEWRRPLTRGAEAMTLFAIMVGALFPLIHLGRVWKFYWMIPVPNVRGLWPNFHSALMWDLLAILTYMTASGLFLFLPLIPDLAAARDRSTGIRRRLYGMLALGWRGSQQQWHRLHVAMKVFTVVIIPIAVSVHSIVSWDFAMTVQEGWKSTVFGPYFVLGAIYSGVAALITVLILVRRGMGLQDYITLRHFDQLGKILLAVSVIWFYLFFAQFLTQWYSGNPVERELEELHVFGAMAPLWWTMVAVNVIIPFFTLWFRRIRTSVPAMLVISVLVNAGMWIERYLIVVGSNVRNHLPFNWGEYVPQWPEIVIAAGTFFMFGFLYVALSKALPFVSLWEVKEGWRRERWEARGLTVEEEGGPAAEERAEAALEVAP